MFVWPHPPNWRQSFEATLRFQTKVLTSREGKQQRIAQRFEPRIMFEYQAMAARDRFMQMQRELFQELRNEIVLPFWPDRRITTAAISAGATVVPVSEARPWMQQGARLCLVHDGVAESALIASVASNNVTLATALTLPWLEGSHVLEGFQGRMDEDTRQRGLTSEVSTVDVAFEVTPGSELQYTPQAAGTTFDGLEVFEFPVNWNEAQRIEIKDPRVMIDYGYGTTETFHPYDFPTVTRRVNILRNGFDAVKELEDFYRRHRGMQKQFYVANAARDLRATAGIVSGTTTLIVDELENADFLTGNTVHRAIAVKTTSGTLYNQIVSAVAGTNSTTLTVRNAWASTVALADIGKVSFLNVGQFASDAFSLEWRSDNVATTQVAFNTLEDFWSAG